MVLLVVSQFFTDDRSVAYGLLLAATACLGAGFGLTAPALNSFTAVFHPAAVDRSVLVLNALLGLGTALAPVFVAVFVGLGFWWGLPVMSAVLLGGLLAVSLPLPLRAGARAAGGGRASAGISGRFWVFAAFAVLYGVCETMNGNWAQLDMTRQLGASATLAALALTAFWAMVTAGRVLFALVERWLPTTVTYRVLPFLLAGALLAVALLPRGTPALGVLTFGLAGLGCSALLPLTISFGQEQLVRSASVAGG
jgi:fucose permease